MKLQLRLPIIIACILSTAISHAQPNESIKPKSFIMSAKLFSAPAELSYTFDLAAATDIDKREDKAGHMPKFARSISTDISLSNSGTWTALPDGGMVWQLRVSAAGALGLIPCYDQFYIPDGASLHVYSPDRGEVIGAFTSQHNPADGRYNTGLLHGSSLILEYYEPASVRGRGRIHLNQLGYAYRMMPGRKESLDFGASESCEVNVACSEGTQWQDQKNAVVRILVETQGSFGWCSGSLVNNVTQDCTPYVLSADHCYQDDITGVLPSATDLSQWVFYFQFESPTCANPSSVGTLANHFLTGCTFKAASLDTGGNSGSDFALLKMNTSPPTSYIPYYAGWSNVNVTSATGVGIHHPNADIKKISTYLTPLVSVSWGGVAANTHWQILWAATLNGHGVTEPGSSGSPLFDANKHIIGTLTGGGSDCSTPTNNDYYGKFAYHWGSNGSTANKRLQSWLDPYNTGAQTLDGTYSPCAASVPLDAGIAGIQQGAMLCDSAVDIALTLTNYGSQTLTSDVLSYTLDGGTAQTYNWTGSLSTFQSTTVTLPDQTFGQGSHTVTITSSQPNGGTDGNSGNNTTTKTFTVAGSSAQYTFFLQTGDQGNKITWELVDAQNYIRYSGGPYDDNAAGVQIGQNWCLPAGCYTFNIYSSASNGLTGTNVAGSYQINTASGTLIAHNTIVNFGKVASASFCTGASGISDVSTDVADVTIYPNPSTGIYTLAHTEHVTSVIVTDALGRLIKGSTMSGQSAQQIDLSGEETGVYFFKIASAEGSIVKKVILNSGK